MSLSDKPHIVGNESGLVSERLLQENKSRQFPKNNISYPLIRTRTCAYQGVRNGSFSENLVCFVFLQQPFGNLLFRFITSNTGIRYENHDQRKRFINSNYYFVRGHVQGAIWGLFGKIVNGLKMLTVS